MKLKRTCRTCANLDPHIYNDNWYDIESDPDFRYTQCKEYDIPDVDNCHIINDCEDYKPIDLNELFEVLNEQI